MEDAEGPTGEAAGSGTDAAKTYSDDLIPDLGLESDWPDVTGYIKDNISIRTIYTTFVPKVGGIGRPVSGGKETFIRCPSPSHVDKKPSAWMQEREGLWFCAGCQVGGDVFDLAAYATGQPLPGYRTNAAAFVDVVADVQDRLGITDAVVRSAGYVSESRPAEAADVSSEWPEDFTEDEMALATTCYELWGPDGPNLPNAHELAVHNVLAQRSVAERAAELAAAPAEPELDPEVSRDLDIAIATMVETPTSSEVASNYNEALEKGLLVEVGCDPQFPHVNWEDILPTDSPIYRMLRALCVNEIPDEYFIWSIYTALGSLIGRRVEMASADGAVDPALWTVIIGGTGSRKSTVAIEMEAILGHVAPPSGSEGVKLIALPASGEKYMDVIRRDEVIGVGESVESVECTNAASFMYVDEFSALGTMLARPGNTLGSVMLQTYGLHRDRLVRPPEALGRITFPVTGPMVSVLSTTQPSRIANLMDRYDVASGFMNRFVFASGKPRRVCVPMMGFGPDWKAVQDEFQLIQNRLNCADRFIPMHDKAFVDKPWQLTPTGEARDRMRRWITEQNALADENDEYTNDLLARRDVMMMKVIVIMAINRICSGEGFERAKNWTLEDVEAAIGHYPNMKSGWIDTGARMLETEDSRLEQWIIDKVDRSGPRGISYSDLQRQVPKSMRQKTEFLNRAIKAMDESGQLRMVELHKKGSKKITRWIFQPGEELELPDDFGIG